jgi:hypothetical protein
MGWRWGKLNQGNWPWSGTHFALPAPPPEVSQCSSVTLPCDSPEGRAWVSCITRPTKCQNISGWWILLISLLSNPVAYLLTPEASSVSSNPLLQLFPDHPLCWHNFNLRSTTLPLSIWWLCMCSARLYAYSTVGRESQAQAPLNNNTSHAFLQQSLNKSLLSAYIRPHMSQTSPSSSQGSGSSQKFYHLWLLWKWEYLNHRITTPIQIPAWYFIKPFTLLHKLHVFFCIYLQCFFSSFWWDSNIL